jgi:protein-L-isoaspartate(D-aspartate) O-methyltransferase
MSKCVVDSRGYAAIISEKKTMKRLIILALALFVACKPSGSGGIAPENLSKQKNSLYPQQREKMVETQIAARGVTDTRVLKTMRKVPRHLFIPPMYREQAYGDHPVPIGEGQTISQPYIVALMTELMELKGGEKVLEVGTGSGYQAAILAEIASEVYTIEIIESLGKSAEARLEKMGYTNIHVRIGDGYKGWPEVAPFDAIVVTAAPPSVPPPLIAQLKIGGRLVVPVGDFFQVLKVIVKTETGSSERDIIPVRFVPMTGEIQKRK